MAPHRSILVGGLVAFLSDIVHVEPEVLQPAKDAGVTVEIGRYTSESRARSDVSYQNSAVDSLVAAANEILASSGLGPERSALWALWVVVDRIVGFTSPPTHQHVAPSEGHIRTRAQSQTDGMGR